MTLSHPYDGHGRLWLRGNLHTHTSGSDGLLDPADTMDMYAAAGRDYVCLSDHDVFTPPPEHPNLIGVPGVEVSANGPHLLAIGATHPFDCSAPRAKVIADVMADGALCILCHPNWLSHYNHWDQVALESVGPYHGIEIFNSVIDYLEGESHALDRWDRLLSAGHRVWGFANDDLHRPEHGQRAMNVVQTDELTAPAIIAALKAGRFYASSGTLLETIAITDDTFTVASSVGQEIRFIGLWGRMLQCSFASEATYRFTGNEGYVRAEVYGLGKQAAWTQPVFVSA